MSTLPYLYVNNYFTSHPIKGKTKPRNESFSWLIQMCQPLLDLNPNHHTGQLPALCFAPIHGHITASSIFSMTMMPKCTYGKNIADA